MSRDKESPELKEAFSAYLKLSDGEKAMLRYKMFVEMSSGLPRKTQNQLIEKRKQLLESISSQRKLQLRRKPFWLMSSELTQTSFDFDS